MATVSANRHAVMDLDRTMRDESMRDSGDESDVLDNIVFKRPVTRRMSKAAASSTPLTSPVRRRSPRKSSSSSTASLPRPRSSRRSSQATTTSSQSSSSQPQSQSQSQSQTEPQTIVEEPTGMSQELAQVSVASQEPGMEHAGSRSEEPVQGTSHFDDPLMGAETDSAPVATDEGEPLTSVTVDANAGAGQTDTDARSTAPVLVFDTEPRLEPASQTRESKSNRTLLALPVFAVAEETPPAPMVVSDTEDTAPVLPGLDDSTVLSIETPSLSFDTSIPTTTSSASTSISSIPLPEPHVEYTPRRSARLSGISVTSTVSSISASPAIFHPVKIGPKLITSTRQTRTKGKAKAPALDTINGPTDMTSTLFDSTIFTTINKGKEKERVPSPSPSLSPPPVLLSDPKPDVTAPFKPPKLRSLSPESDAVLMNLHQALQPQPSPALQPLSKSSDRPAPLPSAMKRRVVDEIEPSVGSPSKRARFNPDPDPPPAPAPALKLPLTSSNAHSRPTRIRVHPANSITKQQGTGSFTGSYPPIVVRPAGSSPIRPSRPTGPNSSPSRQQLLLQRPAGPPMRVPVGQQQRTLFPTRVASPIRTGSHGSFSSGVAKNVSPAKPRRVEAASAWPTYPSGPNPKSNPPNHIKPTEVLIAPEHTGSSPVRAGRSSRLPVPRARPGEKMGPISEKPSQVDAPESVSVPPASLTEAGREPTPPTPLETPASPGSSSSTLIMDVPLFYQPPAPRLPPIQQRTAEEIIAEGMEREAQRKREGKTAAAAAAAMRCLPLTRAPRRIIPDGSVLQGWASLASASATGSMTESQKELQKITAANTERNNSYKCVIERTESFVNVPRPPSPTSRVRTKAQKAREEERQSRAERALRRSAARGEDTSASESDSRRQSVALAPGEDSEWTEPVREGRRVRWAQELVRHDMGPSGATSVAAGVGRRCLARTYELDRHGNMCNAQPAESSQGPKVVVTRYVYNDEPGFKAWKREQIPGSD